MVSTLSRPSALDGLPDTLWPAIRQLVGIKSEPELGRNHHLPAERSKGLTNQFFIGELDRKLRPYRKR